MAITDLAPDAAEREVPENDGAEESDEYDVGDEGEEGDDDSEEEDEADEGGGGLTALLLGGSVENEEEDDEVWVPDGGKEPADYSGDDEDDVDEKAHPEDKTLNKSSHANVAAVEEKPGVSGDADPGAGKRRREESSGNHVNKKARKL